jgi:hypothetical protein
LLHRFWNVFLCKSILCKVRKVNPPGINWGYFNIR